MKKLTQAVKIAMIEDHVLIRDALATVINGFGYCQVTLLASNGREFIDKLKPENMPDLVILDLNMPNMDGYETARWLRTNYPEIHIIVLTMYDSEITLIRLLQAGVRGFLKKDIHPGELKSAIKSVIQSGYYYSYNSAGRLVNLFKKNSLGDNIPDHHLTDMELAFLKLSSTDLTYKEIAQELSISPRTVDNYRDSLFVKLNVKSRVGLAIYAIRSGIVNLTY